jgi:sec-independent protein translocase protein TatA
MPNIGPLELVVVLGIVLLVFGPKRLPGLGKQLGTGMREFKDSITGKDKGDADEQPSITEAVAARNDAAAVGSAPAPAPAPDAKPESQASGNEGA